MSSRPEALPNPRARLPGSPPPPGVLQRVHFLQYQLHPQPWPLSYVSYSLLAVRQNFKNERERGPLRSHWEPQLSPSVLLSLQTASLQKQKCELTSLG